MHKAENLSGEIRSSVPCTLPQTKTEEGKGQKKFNMGFRHRKVES